MRLRSLGAVCACVLTIPAIANAAFFDFQQWINDNGEQGFDNASAFSLSNSGLTLTATAFDQPGMVNSHVYMDGVFNNIIGGMGVCTTLDINKQCVPSSDDNVSIDGASQEILMWNFSSGISHITLEMGDSQHFLFKNHNFEYQLGAGGSWLTGTTDAAGLFTLNSAASAGNINFRTSGMALTDQFYIRNATTSVVPVPAAVWLFGTGLLGLAGIARKKAA